jgi:hypothetical protein
MRVRKGSVSGCRNSKDGSFESGNWGMMIKVERRRASRVTWSSRIRMRIRNWSRNWSIWRRRRARGRRSGIV